jgi:hypothetical protein
MKYIKLFESFFNEAAVNVEFNKHISDIAFHVINRDTKNQILSQGMKPSSAKKSITSDIRGYKERLFLTFDERSKKDIAKALLDFFRGNDSEAKVSVVEIDWKKFIKDNSHLILYKDPMMQYYKEYQKKGFLGGFFIKEPIPAKYILTIKPLSIHSSHDDKWI